MHEPVSEGFDSVVDKPLLAVVIVVAVPATILHKLFVLKLARTSTKEAY